MGGRQRTSLFMSVEEGSTRQNVEETRKQAGPAKAKKQAEQKGG